MIHPESLVSNPTDPAGAHQALALPSGTHRTCCPDPSGMKARGDAHCPGACALCQLTTCMLMLAPSCSMSSSPRATHTALVLACASPQ